MAALRVVGAARFGRAARAQQQLVGERPAPLGLGSGRRGCFRGRQRRRRSGRLGARGRSTEQQRQQGGRGARGDGAAVERRRSAGSGSSSPSASRPAPIASGIWKRSLRRYENSRASAFCSMPSSAAASAARLVSAGVIRKDCPPVPRAIASSVVMSRRETTGLPDSSRL